MSSVPMLDSGPSTSLARRIVSGLSRLRNRHFLLMDWVVLSLLPAIALFLRVDEFDKLRPYFLALAIYTVTAMTIRLLVFFGAGLYSRCWRYATVDELFHIGVAGGVSTAILCGLFTLISFFTSSLPYLSVPRSLPLIDGLLTVFVIGGMRFSVRLAHRWLALSPTTNARRVLIVGAGNAGQRIVRDILVNPQIDLHPIGFLDDNAHLQGLKILNLPVLGGRDSLPTVVRDQAIDQVIIAIPSASGKEIRHYMTLCKEANVPAKTIPSMSAILEDRVQVNDLRDIDLEDLLRRDPVQTDVAAVRQLVAGKRVLVTGAGGSIGSELCRQILRIGPSEMALLGHGENSIFDIHNELQQLQSGYVNQLTATPTRIQAFIADIREAHRISKIVAEFKPDIIFHAAAHKHVPLMEMNPTEAIANNVMGTKNLVQAAMNAGVRNFVMISTDKAVNPTSIMGASKRAAELIVLQTARNSGYPYVVVRFGNVLGSRGSVVPTFKRQLAKGGPLTVSHPDMTRYFMTIPEAVLLLLQAAVLGKGGEVFMLDMGSPVKIVDLAQDVIRLSGLEVGRDIEIVYTGIRPGEKLYEELFVPGELYQPTHHQKVFIAANASSRIPDALPWVIEDMEHAIMTGRRQDVIDCLHTLIPEFQPDEFRQGKPTPVNHAVVYTMNHAHAGHINGA